MNLSKPTVRVVYDGGGCFYAFTVGPGELLIGDLVVWNTRKFRVIESVENLFPQYSNRYRLQEFT